VKEDDQSADLEKEMTNSNPKAVKRKTTQKTLTETD